jgi:Flp pilus assembly protein TadG
VRSQRASDRGAVTVEAALALSSLLLVLSLLIGVMCAMGAQLRCLDAAREAARLITRGESDRAHAVVAAIAPTNARLVVRMRGDEVTVTVSGAAVGRLAKLTVSGEAVGILEPGVVAR